MKNPSKEAVTYIRTMLCFTYNTIKIGLCRAHSNIKPVKFNSLRITNTFLYNIGFGKEQNNLAKFG